MKNWKKGLMVGVVVDGFLVIWLSYGATIATCVNFKLVFLKQASAITGASLDELPKCIPFLKVLFFNLLPVSLWFILPITIVSILVGYAIDKIGDKKLENQS